MDFELSGINYLIAKKSLDAVVMKQEGISSNIANIQTPGYKRVELGKTFDDRLAEITKQKDLKSMRSELNFLTPNLVTDKKSASVRPDGNNVSLEHELASMSKNSVEHQFLTTIISNSIKRMKMAISTNSNSGA